MKHKTRKSVWPRRCHKLGRVAVRQYALACIVAEGVVASNESEFDVDVVYQTRLCWRLPLERLPGPGGKDILDEPISNRIQLLVEAILMSYCIPRAARSVFEALALFESLA
jgi:hypothetical protein